MECTVSEAQDIFRYYAALDAAQKVAFDAIIDGLLTEVDPSETIRGAVDPKTAEAYIACWKKCMESPGHGKAK